MKIYKLNMIIWDYWFTCDKDGYKHDEKFFTTKEKAEKWIEEHKTFCNNISDEIATKEYQMPKYEIEEIEVE